MKILSRARLTVAVVGAAGVASLGMFVGQAAHAQRAGTSTSSTTSGDDSTPTPSARASAVAGTPGASAKPLRNAPATVQPRSAGSKGKVSSGSGSSGNGGSHGS